MQSTTQLTSLDEQRLARVRSLLVAPFDHGDVDSWRAEVNRACKELLHADSAGFLLPACDGLPLYSEEHDLAELSRYPEMSPPTLRDGRSIFARAMEFGVCTLEQAYGNEYDCYLSSQYYREYARPNGACDTLAALLPLPGTGVAEQGTVASLQFWHARDDGRRFSQREVDLTAMLYPAFRAGIMAHSHWWGYRMALTTILDDLRQAVGIWDVRGQLLHRTPAVQSLLAAAPDADCIWNCCARIARSLGESLARTPLKSNRNPTPASEVISGSCGTFLATGAVYSIPGESAPLILVSLVPHGHALPSSEALQARWGLTPQEARVTTLLAGGRTNRDIARELSISEATARRHTERVFLKLDVRSRAGVAPRISGRW